MTPSTQPALLSEAQHLARAHGATLILGLGVWRQDPPPLENKLALVLADGAEPRFFHKANPIFMAESSVLEAGPETIPIIFAGASRVSAVICHDLDFPHFLRQAGRARIDLMFAPSADWPEIAQMHATMATLRAVENGFVLARPASGGHTAVIDTRGREATTTLRPDNIRLADIPIAHAWTVYPAVGDAWVWLISLLVALRFWRVRRQSTDSNKPLGEL